jgi:hypothetical protein
MKIAMSISHFYLILMVDLPRLWARFYLVGDNTNKGGKKPALAFVGLLTNESRNGETCW